MDVEEKDLEDYERKIAAVGKRLAKMSKQDKQSQTGDRMCY